MSKHVFTLFYRSFSCFIASLVVDLIGLPLVWIGVHFVRTFPETERDFTDPTKAAGKWKLVRLPTWLLPWDNAYDGLLGDKRGWWNNYCLENYKKPATDPYCMWQWAAVRNSGNYFSRNMIGCDVSKCNIVKIAGNDLCDEDNPGWHLLCATDRETGKQYPYFGWVRFITKDHYAYIRMGWKIKLSHNGTTSDSRDQDRFKGNVFRFSPWKAH